MCLKIGRYKKTEWYNEFRKNEILEVSDPKSELTLEPDELDNLVTYINDNYYPLFNDENSYLSLDANSASGLIRNNYPQISQLIKAAIENDIDLTDINKLIEIADRKNALKEFEKYFKSNALESDWQKWFQKNYWVFGSDFISLSQDRRIDVENITDFIAKNIDGFVDVIEIKRPGDSMDFFEKSKDHGNLVPSKDLIKAITQLSNYLCTLESKSNEVDTTKRLGKILKPRGILIYGKSTDWKD